VQVEILEALKGRIFEYAVIPTGEITFSPELIKACETNVCGKYKKNWVCPPAVGYELLREKVLGFSHAFVFTTKAHLEDSFDFEGMINAKNDHNKITAEIHERFGNDNPVFGAGGCEICETCAYPDPCRFPDRVFISLEAAGINVTELSRTGGVHYNNGENTITYFSMVLFNK
jgi:predicted metal-binding protein